VDRLAALSARLQCHTVSEGCPVRPWDSVWRPYAATLPLPLP